MKIFITTIILSSLSAIAGIFYAIYLIRKTVEEND